VEEERGYLIIEFPAECASRYTAATFWLRRFIYQRSPRLKCSRTARKDRAIPAVFGVWGAADRRNCCDQLGLLEVASFPTIGTCSRKEDCCRAKLGEFMRILKYGAVLAILFIAASLAQAQVAVGVRVGPGYYDYDDIGLPPNCVYGYYSYYPYACAPYGYYGPDYFIGGVFIGAGPWYHSYDRGYWPRYYSRGYYGRGYYGDRRYGHGYYGGRGYGYRGGYDHGFRGGYGGGYNRGGGFHGYGGGRGYSGRGFHGGAGHYSGGGYYGGGHGRR
jgi:hypothetical protein